MLINAEGTTLLTPKKSNKERISRLVFEQSKLVYKVQ